jgi:hypothetical protein
MSATRGSSLPASWRPGLLLALALALTGCVTKAKAKADARAAYAAGQQETLRRLTLARSPTVTINGEVRNPIVPWTEDLTLAKAIVAAEYCGHSDPGDVIIVRAGQATRVDLKQLLAGQDVPLQPGDIVELRRQPPPR